MLIRMIRMIGISLGFLVIVSLITSIPVSAKLQPPASDQQQVVAAAPAAAVVTIELCAKSGAITTPDGVSTPIWGFSNYTGVTGGNPDGCDPAQLPGPELRVNPGDEVTITLHNLLGVPTSILFPGLPIAPPPDGVYVEPTDPGIPGLFTAQATDSGGTVTYKFIAGAPGTYLYESGTDIDKQVAMGLYGALIVGDAGGADIDKALVLSEIDPALNGDPTNFDMEDYHPVYWLINGEAYPDTDPIVAETGDTVLLRYLNAGATHDTMSLIGLYQDVIAKNGFNLPMSYSAYAETIASGETLETLVDTTGTAAGDRFPLFNRQLHMTNGPFGPDQVGPDGGGGMMTFIQVGANEPPLVVNDDYSIADDEILTTFALGTPPGVLDNDSDPNPADTLTAIKVSDPFHGNLTAFNPDGSFTYEPTVGFNAGALQFAGVSDYASAPLDGTTLTALTIEMWLKPNATSSTGIFQWANALSASTPFVYFHDDAGTFRLYVDNGYRLTTPLTLNQWDHIAVTYDGTDWRLYQNGQEVGVYTGGTQWQPNASGLYLGNGYHGYWNGQIDDVRVWSVARSQTDIQNDLSATLTGAETDLIGYWPLDEGTGTSAADLAGSNNASLVNGPTWLDDSNVPASFNTDFFTYKANDGTVDSNDVATATITLLPGNLRPVTQDDSYSVAKDGILTAVAGDGTTPGVLDNDSDADSDPLTALLVSGPVHGTLTLPLQPDGSFTYEPTVGANLSALQFAGASDYASAPLDGTTLTALTIEMWLKPNATSSTGIFQWANALSASTPFVYFHDDAGTFRLYVDNGYRLTTPLTLNQWDHIAVTYDGTDWRLYQNGQEVGVYTGGTQWQPNASELYLGNGYHGYWNGQIDDVRVWDSARSQGDIQSSMSAALSGSEPGLIGYWPLEDGLDPTADLAGGNDASLVNGPTWVTTDLPPNTDYFTYVANDGTVDSNETLVTINLTPATGPIYGVEVTPATDAKSDAPEVTVAYTLEVTNTGNVADSFTVGVSSINGWTTTTTPPSPIGPLGAGISTTLMVDVTIPAGALDGEFDMATVTLTSQVDGSASDFAELTTSAVVVPPPVYGVEVTPPTDAKSGDEVTTVVYTLYVTNTGDTEDTFTVGVSGNSWPTTTTPPSPIGPLGAGISTTLTVDVEIPLGVGGASDTAIITVTPDGGGASDFAELTTTANTYGVEVTPATDTKSGDAGTTVVYTLHVTNTGNTIDTFDVTTTTIWALTAPATVGPLNPNESAAVDVSVTIPLGALDTDSDVATIQVISQGDNAQSDSSELTTTVSPIYGVEVTPATDSQSAAPGMTVTYTLQVTNTGNTEETFDVAVSGNSWTTDTAPPTTTVGPLAAGASTSIDVTVNIPGGAVGGDSDMATVTVTSQVDSGQSASSDLTTTANTIHIGDLDQAAEIVNTNTGMWRASVTFTVHDIDENPVSGAEVTLIISRISKATGNPIQEIRTCTTNEMGYCTEGRLFNPANVEDEATFIVDNVSHPVLVVYEAFNNHDPDPAPQDSDGTTIIVVKP